MVSAVADITLLGVLAADVNSPGVSTVDVITLGSRLLLMSRRVFPLQLVTGMDPQGPASLAVALGEKPSRWPQAAVTFQRAGVCSSLAGNVILESPVHPVTEGDSVTLNCTHRNQTSLISKVEFYKDGVLFTRNETRGEMTIPTVSKSHEGFYRCKYYEEESPGSWVTVRATAGVSTATGSDDVMYAQIQLKKPDKKKKKKQASPKESSVYSELKPGNATATSGPVDVTYAEIELKEKAKAKKKKKLTRPPEAGAVYAQVKPGRAHGP
ncbi:hypothetical protein UPYG_G00236820 [Umbra pygmaea]|uniref:Ig-like domain-containing protein n=1 Tax=Umbra pygmaea TaxID=75934 RepID=A0ABD0WFC2_UMBPY